MANTVITFPEMPSYLAKRQRSHDKFLSGLGGQQPARISIKGNRFTLIDKMGTETPVNSLELGVIVVDTNPNPVKIFYTDPYNVEDTSPPDCISSDGIYPSSKSPLPQAERCAICPQNIWGSAVSNMTGKKKKACQDGKSLAVLVPQLGNGLYLLRVTPGSFDNWKTYVHFLRDSGNVSLTPTDVITQITFESQGVLAFRPVGYLSEAQVAEQESYLGKEEIAEILGLNGEPHKGPFALKVSPLPEPPREQREPPKEQPPQPERQTRATSGKKGNGMGAGFMENPSPPPAEVQQALQNAFGFKLS